MNRKGTKHYKPGKISEKDLQTILLAGTAAPNAFNRQAWNFTAVLNPELLAEIDRETAIRLDEPGTHPLYGAPVLIILSSAKDNGFAKQDCSAANQNMALAAKSLGLASRFLDVPNLYLNAEAGRACKRRCGIPDDYDTVCFLSLGHPADEQEPPTPKDTSVIHIVY